MKKIALVLLAGCAAAACSPQIHLDFLGKDTLQEVVLVPSPAGEKILVIDVDGMISAFAAQGASPAKGTSSRGSIIGWNRRRQRSSD